MCNFYHIADTRKDNILHIKLCYTKIKNPKGRQEVNLTNPITTISFANTLSDNPNFRSLSATIYILIVCLITYFVWKRYSRSENCNQRVFMTFAFSSLITYCVFDKLVLLFASAVIGLLIYVLLYICF